MAGEYGYFAPGAGGVISQPAGQNAAGFLIGILYIDEVNYPLLPGNVVNACTYSYPVAMEPVEGLTIEQLFAAGDEVLPMLLAAASKLQRKGVRAITGACGFFGNYQREIASALDVPVALSSLVQLPWMRMLLKPAQPIGVLTADLSSLTDRLLAACGTTSREGLVLRDLRHAEAFSCILEGRGTFDNEQVRREVVSAALDAQRERPDLGAILLECSDMPPYAVDVQRATGLPVFDFTTLIDFLHSAVAHKPFSGFI